MIVNIKTLELNETNYNEIINLYNYFSINDKTILDLKIQQVSVQLELKV